MSIRRTRTRDSGQSRQAPPTADRPRDSERLLDAFRYRLDSFLSDPRAAEFKQKINKEMRPPSRLSPASALRSRLRDRLAPIEAKPKYAAFRLQKGMTYRDGRLTALWGDSRPLASNDQLLVVTTTTTFADAESVVVETDVLVFERGAGR